MRAILSLSPQKQNLASREETIYGLSVAKPNVMTWMLDFATLSPTYGEHETIA